MTSPMQVPVPVRLRMAHGCLDHIARGAGVRILHLKGEALHPLLAEGRAASSDCDVLVDPAQVAPLVAALEADGWGQVTTFEHGSVFAHAATFHHRVWGTADLHRAFPGLDRDAAATFEQLWAHRESVDLGGAACAVPDLTAQRLVLLVHAARDASGRSRHDVRVAWTEVDGAERARIEGLAAELGAQVPLALAIGRPETVEGLPGARVWQAVHDGAAPRDVWRARLQDADGALAKARLLVEALRVNRDHLGLRLGHAPSRKEVRREWWARWGRLLCR